jgi:hypothetical protein
MWIAFIGVKITTTKGSCEHDNDASYNKGGGGRGLKVL